MGRGVEGLLDIEEVELEVRLVVCSAHRDLEGGEGEADRVPPDLVGVLEGEQGVDRESV